MKETVRRIHFKNLEQRPVALRTMDDVPDKCYLDIDNGFFSAGVAMDRQALLDLRDCCDAILQEWLCPEPKTLCPVCEREYGGLVPALGGNKEGMDCTTFIPCEVEDDIEQARRQT